MSNELEKAEADLRARMFAEDAKLLASLEHIQNSIAAAEIEPYRPTVIYGLSAQAYVWLMILTALIAGLVAFAAIEAVIVDRLEARIAALEAAE